MKQTSKFKVGDCVKCVCPFNCGVVGTIFAVDNKYPGDPHYLLVLKKDSEIIKLPEHTLVLDQESTNEQKIRKLLGVK